MLHMCETIIERVECIDWGRIHGMIKERGYAMTQSLLSAAECKSLTELYDLRERFRSRVDMARLRFGVGEYKYFAHPLPPLVAALRNKLYPHVAPIANEWMEALGLERRFPRSLAAFLDHCRREGQTKPTPLMLRYDHGGYNCLHQDVYGEIVFPLQFTVMLSRPETDFSGGEFLLMEQRPRSQSRCDAIELKQGEAILFATRHRPVRGARGYYRVNVKHGVSTINRGCRFTLGIIFHDAK
jgi:uncharacterized protein